MVVEKALKILTVDDDQDLREVVNLVLSLEGYQTLSAGDGHEALQLLYSLDHHELPDLILLDYAMPCLNGGGFYKKLALDPTLSKIPVVLMTANANLREIMDQMNADAYLSKPMDMDNILHVAKNFIHRREAARYSFLT